jgi:CRISPR/Cas system-associated exonuclease Cas4 (RecB family)
MNIMTKNLLQQVMNNGDMPNSVNQEMNELITKIQSGYISKRGAKHQQKKTFAPSTIAYGHGECARYWYLAFEGGTFEDYADPFAGANMTNGTKSHERIQQAMEDAGMLIDSEFKITYDDPPIFGYGDVILNWKGEELLGEIKTAMSEGFEYRKKSGKAKAGHLIQILIYMKILKKARGILIYENKNNHELLAIPVNVNDYYIKWVDQAFEWMRTVRKAWENKKLPTKNYRSNSKICKTCPLAKVCDSAGEGDIKIKSLEPLDEKLSVV